jgi:hypothetical protein
MDNLEQAIILDSKWAAQSMAFLLDNPEFQPFKEYLPITRWKNGNNRNRFERPNKYSPSNINDFMIKLICDKYYDSDLYKNIKDGFVPSSEIPIVIKKVKRLPIFNTYDTFYNYIKDELDMDYFEPELNRLQLFSLFTEVDFNWNEDINSFRLYGLFDRQVPNPPDPDLEDVWMNEFKFICGMEKVYKRDFKNGYEALMQAQKWKRYHYVGYVMCLLI